MKSLERNIIPVLLWKLWFQNGAECNYSFLHSLPYVCCSGWSIFRTEFWEGTDVFLGQIIQSLGHIYIDFSIKLSPILKI